MTTSVYFNQSVSSGADTRRNQPQGIKCEAGVRRESKTATIGSIDSLAKCSTMDTIDNSNLDDGQLSNSSTLTDLPWPLIPDCNGSRAASHASSGHTDSLQAVDEFEPISPSRTGRRHTVGGMAPFVPNAPQVKKPNTGRPIPSQFQTPKAVAEQQGLTHRLGDLKQSDFHSQGVAICMTMPMEVPDTFASVSYNIKFHRGVALLQAKDVQLVRQSALILMFCDVSDEEQLKLARHMCSYVVSLGQNAPQIVLAPHASNPNAMDSADEKFAALSKAMDCVQVNAMISGEPEGLKLASEVRSKLMMHSKRARALRGELKEHRKRVEETDQLRLNVKVIVWEYFSFRLGLPIPAQDLSIECEQGAEIGNFTVGKELGSGSCGKVFKLDAKAIRGRASKGQGQVAKMILKSENESFRGLVDLCNEVNIMQQLDHPNIIKLYEVYHAEHHIVLRMEDGGSQNLFEYLHRLECKRLPLGPLKAEGIVLQCLAALCHMHMGPGVAHRDIKPENIVARETRQGIEIKICDFDLSRVMPEGKTCQSVCGTFPFMAPEIGEGTYDPFPTDVWSMALVFLEVTCCCRVLTKAVLHYNSITEGDRKDKKQITMPLIRAFFQKPANVARVVDRYCKNELKAHIKASMTSLFEDMLCITVSERLTAEDISDVDRWPENCLFSTPD